MALNAKKMAMGFFFGTEEVIENIFLNSLAVGIA
jgi:hypothetical protein